MREFDLPPVITELVEARKQLRAHYETMLRAEGSDVDLHFTLDGNLIGDIGEALAAQLFGIRLVNAKSTEGIDGYTPDGQSTVQVKTTGTGRGPAFRCVETRADYLLFFDLDMERCKGAVVYNGPEHYVTEKLPSEFSGQRALTPKQIRDADGLVEEHERLPFMSATLDDEVPTEWTIQLDDSLVDDLSTEMGEGLSDLREVQEASRERSEKLSYLLEAARRLGEDLGRLQRQIEEVAKSTPFEPSDEFFAQLQVVAGSPNELGGLKVEIFANEHPPPHFRVKMQSSTANYRIADCKRMDGSGEVLRYEKTIRKWWERHKIALIDTWNDRRPSDCPVGRYVE